MRCDKLRRVAVIVLLPFFLAGCLFGPEPSSQEIDPPPDTTAVDSHAADEEGEEAEIEDVDEDGEELESAATQEVELYLQGPEGHVVPYSVAIPQAEGIAEKQLSYMVKDGPISEIEGLPDGFKPLIPAGTEIYGINIKESGVADVDLSKQFLDYDADDEEDILSAITWALTAWDSIDTVNVWINGTPLEEMPHGKASAVNMTRDNTAINIEVANGVQISDSMPVTLYFLGQSEDDTYFVPVTRMVPRSDDVVKTAMEELVAGPLQSSNLQTEILDNLAVNDIQVEDDVVRADFGEQLLEYGQENKASENAIQSIVLSLTENTGASQVMLSVDGDSNIASENVSLSEPVSRPAKVNPFGL